MSRNAFEREVPPLKTNFSCGSFEEKMCFSDLVAAAQGEVRLREGFLGDIIGPLSGDDRGGIPAQGRAVAPEDLRAQR